MLSSEIGIEEQLDAELFPVKALIMVLEDCQILIDPISEPIQFQAKEIIAMQFNPTNYSVTANSSVDSTEPVMKEKQVLKYKPVGPDSLKLSFIYDAEIQLGWIWGKIGSTFEDFSEAGDLYASYLKKFRALVHETEKGHPPYIKFRYGSFYFIGWATSVSINCTRFHRNGKVLRAEITIDMQQIGVAEEVNVKIEDIIQDQMEEEVYLYLNDLFASD